MSADSLRAALSTPGHIWFPENQPFRERFDESGGRMVCQPSGHLIFYRPDGRRFFAADPFGNPLHECEWTQDGAGRVTLSRVRLKLDWGAWVGLVPGGLVNESRMDLAKRPGWERLKADDLRAMAAQALRVPLDEVRWFYRDEDVAINPSGVATIRQRKDAFYELEKGGFDRATFLSCMGAMHWSSIDFLPVVELFKSLLPGTGSAVFELIRGLYDDQNGQRPQPLPLRYRGIPTYPSEAAFRLFSSFFTPVSPSSGDVLATFMNPVTSHRITWLPSPSPPLRYFDRAAGCCLTFQGGTLLKATFADDSTGLPYGKPRRQGFTACDRIVVVSSGKIVARDRRTERVLPLPIPTAQDTPDADRWPFSPIDWRSLFPQGVPTITAEEAFGAVLRYPQDESEIDELALQPFVADYLQDLSEQDRDIGTRITKAERVLIENGDAVAATCIPFDRPRDYTVRMRIPAFAQRQAQQLWGLCAELQRWDWMARIKFLPMTPWRQEPGTQSSFDLAYVWTPATLWQDRLQLLTFLKELRLSLRSGGCAFVMGPATLSGIWALSGFRASWQEQVEQLPTFRMHKTILPKARVPDGVTLFCVSKV